MFQFGIVLILAVASIIMISAWFSPIKQQYKFIHVLVYPYAGYFLFILSIGIENLDTYMKRQFFTASLAYFAIYSLFLMLLLVRMTEGARKEN